jgi:hypothetical protein
MTPQDRTAQTLRSLQNENLILNSQKARLKIEKHSEKSERFCCRYLAI